MRLPKLLLRAAYSLALLALATPGAHATDHALVVGINNYPKLTRGLAGCVNDAVAMGLSLKKYGFQVTLLKDEQATRATIVNALHEIATMSKKSDRLVFYFAGHGSQLTDRSSVLLMSDSGEAVSDNDMTPEELVKAVRSVPARSHSVILDSCFSGGMMRGVKSLGGRHITTRFYVRGGGDKSLQRVRAQEVNDDKDNKVASKSGVCYFAASRPTEQAGEDDFSGTRHGVFTFYITGRLNGEKEPWGELETAVRGDVAKYMEDNQHPMLSPGYQSIGLFEGTEDDTPTPPTPPTPPAPVHHDMWDTYNSDHRDDRQLVMSLHPDSTPVPVNTNLWFNLDIGSDGFLVVLEKFNNTVQVIYPYEDEALQVSAGTHLTIPGKDKEGHAQAYAPDTPGTEFVKAILFKNREDAESLIASFHKDADGARKSGWDGFSRALHRRQVSDNPFVTSDLSFEVRPGGEIVQ